MCNQSLKVLKLSIVVLSIAMFSSSKPSYAVQTSAPMQFDCYHFHVNDWGIKIKGSYLGLKNAFLSCDYLYQQQVMEEHNNGVIVSKAGVESYQPEFEEHKKLRPDDPNCVIDTYDPMEPNY